MNRSITRNWEQRKALSEKIHEMAILRESEVDALPDEMDFDEWNTAYSEIMARYDDSALVLKEKALEYKESKNAWFSDFVKSFGICNSRRITHKQAEIFVRYSEARHEWRSGRGMQYFVRVGGLFIETHIYSEKEPGYVTITELQ